MNGASRSALVWGALLVAVGAAGWLFHEEVLDWWRGTVVEAPPPGEVSPELAGHAEDRLREFARGEGADSLVLGTAALASLLRYRGEQGILPSGVEDPEVVLTDSTALLSAFVRFRELAAGESAEQLSGIFGDSTEVRVELVPGLVRTGLGEVRVRSLQAGGLTVPTFLIPRVLRQSGLPVQDGRTRSVVFAVPPRLTGIEVRGGELVLRRSAATARGA